MPDPLKLVEGVLLLFSKASLFQIKGWDCRCGWQNKVASLYHEKSVEDCSQQTKGNVRPTGEDETISEMWCPVLGQEECGKPERVLGIMTYGERLRELGWFSLEKSLGNGQIIRQRAIHSHEVHFRKLMVDVKRIFSTQMLT